MSVPQKKKPKNNQPPTNLLDRLEECERGGQFTLDINGLSLGEWPKETVIVTGINTCLAYNNCITEIPSLEEFRNLEHVSFSRNMLTQLSSCNISFCNRLRYLDISRNELSELPTDITSLPLLSTIVANRNNIKSLPEGMSQMRSLRKVPFDRRIYLPLPEHTALFW
jgi:hypothetical protein